MLPVLPPAQTLIGDKGMTARHSGGAEGLKIKSCIPPRKNRKDPVDWCKTTYKKRHKVENMFAKLKTGAGLPCDMTDAPILASRQSASPLPSYFGWINES